MNRKSLNATTPARLESARKNSPKNARTARPCPPPEDFTVFESFRLKDEPRGPLIKREDALDCLAVCSRRLRESHKADSDTDFWRALSNLAFYSTTFLNSGLREDVKSRWEGARQFAQNTTHWPMLVSPNQEISKPTVKLTGRAKDFLAKLNMGSGNPLFQMHANSRWKLDPLARIVWELMYHIEHIWDLHAGLSPDQKKRAKPRLSATEKAILALDRKNKRELPELAARILMEAYPKGQEHPRMLDIMNAVQNRRRRDRSGKAREDVGYRRDQLRRRIKKKALGMMGLGAG